MPDRHDSGSPDTITSYLAPGGDNVKLVYLLYLASLLIGITVLIGLVMAYMNRSQVAGGWPESHYRYQIRTFWIGLLYALVSTVLMVLGIGFLLIVAVAVWAIVRCVKGLQLAAVGRPVADPATWMV